jgi:hypothetical protein
MRCFRLIAELEAVSSDDGSHRGALLTGRVARWDASAGFATRYVYSLVGTVVGPISGTLQDGLQFEFRCVRDLADDT